jgi:tetratricopeptide (TPR) repeat protein
MENQHKQIVNVDAENFKDAGNECYRAGEFQSAVEYFTKAIEIDQENSKYLINRSLCYASLKLWTKSGDDAKQAVKLDPKNAKAHFRLIKSLLELHRVKEARLCLNIALKECGDVKEFKTLEQQLFELTGVPQRPNSNDFDILTELGDGNFTKIYKASYKKTGKIYAIKVFMQLFYYRCRIFSYGIASKLLSCRQSRRPLLTE